MDEDDDDEFNDDFDDIPTNELEESLNRLEESFHSQRQQQSPSRQTPLHANNTAFTKRSAVDGANGRQNNVRSVASKRNAPTPGIDDFRVSHQGHVQGGSILPAGDDEFEDDGATWSGMDLDRIDNEAMELSQRSQHKRTASAAKKREGSGRSLLGSVVKQLEDRPTKRARDNNQDSGSIGLSNEGRDERLEAELRQDRKRIEELEDRLAKKEEEIARYRKENQTKLGEVSLLRSNMNKTVADFSSVLREKEEVIAKQKSLNNEMKRMHEEQLARNETINAFRHTELATTAHWSSITASVARRRGGGGVGVHSSQRNYSQSHSQTAAAAVGLTTPTRKNRGPQRNLGSGGGKSDRSGGESGSKAIALGEESPSSRRSQARLQRQQLSESASKSKPKPPAFPGFVNSFIKPSEQTPRPVSKAKNAAKVDAEERQPEMVESDDVVFQDDGPSAIEEDTEIIERVTTPSQHVSQQDESEVKEGIPTGWSHPQYRYLWAISTYSKRLNFLSSLILSHTSSACLSNSPHAISHDSTFYRLLNASMSTQTPLQLQEQYIIATHRLLNILSQGSAVDTEEQLAYLLDKFPYEEVKDQSKVEKQSQDEEEFWGCQILMDEGFNEVLSEIASVLCTMMAISFQAGMMERLYDVCVLMRSICIHHPWMIHAILSIDSSSGKIRDRGTTSHSSADEATLQPIHLEVELDKIIIACIQKLCINQGEEEDLEVEPQSIGSQTSDQLLRATIGIMHIMSYQIRDNDPYSLNCTHKVKRIIDEPGLLASLLDYNRRSTSTIRETIAVLTKLSQHKALWRNLIACKMDKNLEPQRRMNHILKSSETPLLEILARVLVDGRVKSSVTEAHAIHCDILTLVSQLTILHSDALVLISESPSILAAVIKCLQLDTGLIWNSDGEEIRYRGDVKVMDIVQRICMDVRLLSLLYITPKRPTNLFSKLQSPDTHLLLNGVKHCFILAISRVAFAPEPDWFDGESSHLLGTVNEIAANLLEVVLSPEELESAWEMLNDEEEEDEELEHVDQEQEQEPEEEEKEVESQIQMDQDGREVIVLS